MMTPVFIGGCGRSGTTLLGSMLGAHSRCLCVPESPFKIELLRSRFRGLDARATLRRVIGTRRFKLWGLDPDAVARALEQAELSYAAGLECLVRQYGERVGKSDVAIWIDHTPSNIRFAASLCELFPDARFIHVVRDGRGVASSILPLDWGPNTIDRAAQWWIDSLCHGLAAESWGGAARVLRVRYEDVVESPERSNQQICTYLGIAYESAMLSGDGFKVPSYTRRQHSLVGKAPQAHRATAWERELTPRQVEIFESLAGQLLGYLGYPLRYGLNSRKPSRSEKWLLSVREFYSEKLVNRIRFRRRRALGN